MQRSRDSAILQFVFARENDSVAAAKREISVVLAFGEIVIEFGSEVEVMGEDPPWLEVGEVDNEDAAFPASLTMFSRPRIFGIKKLYAIPCAAGGASERMDSNISFVLAIWTKLAKAPFEGIAKAEPGSPYNDVPEVPISLAQSSQLQDV